MRTSSDSRPLTHERLATLFRAAMMVFVVAALTGVVFRGVIAWGWDPGASLTNLRHAHSHAMFFGWITPATFILIAARLPTLTGRAIRARCLRSSAPRSRSGS